MSAQPDPTPASAAPYAPAPGGAAELLARLRAGRPAEQWVPAFERDWAKALEDACPAFSLTPLHEVVRTWQLRVAAAPDADDFMDSGQDDSDVVDLDDVLGGRP
ncbi:DUF6247 family protein [Streptomyces avidinii]|uniref:Uncharacterized protein n=1 Tax=Streptomyces avidinii TaxID=1895 RepID=A0ABS4KXJ5_STRAV|nr:DUF6247 family protein [Streptomyces avidinii]MBP2034759.1 hypothetical protein [Streptomyces avidinii]GGY88674.1 hypothetical protein GCM10010343_12290 [Streptomyces avidinii]